MDDVAKIPAHFRGHLMYLPPPPEERSAYRSQKDWQTNLCKEAIDYAISRHSQRRTQQVIKMNRLYNSYIGLVNEEAFNWLQSTYGALGSNLYHDYRLSKTKLDQLQGEWLLRPLSTTVYSINSEARTKMLEDYTAMVGIKHAAKEIEKLRKVVGVDPFNGMQGPGENDKDDDIWKYVSAKQQNNFLMQEILNKLVEKEDVKTKLSENLSDLSIVAECFGKAYIDEHGFTKYRDIDPRHALFEETTRDPFLHRSPYLGEERPLYIHEVYANWALNEDQRKRVEQQVNEYNNKGLDWQHNNYYSTVNGGLAIRTHTIEWFALKPYHFQKFNDRTNVMSNEFYGNNKDKVAWEVKKGKYQLETKYKMVTWEASKIGHDLYLDAREKPNCPVDLENPFNTMRSYTGLLFNTKNGVRVSIQQQLAHVNKLYNITMFQIQRETSKYKGKVLPFDGAAVPKGETVKSTLAKITNDGILYYNSSAEGNKASRDLDIRNTLKEVDMGLSASFPELISLKAELEHTADTLTGINAQRRGQTQASSTATNAQSDLQQSYAITEPFSYMFNEFCEQILYKMMQNGKITYGYLHPDKGAMLLGDKGLKFINDTSAIGTEDYNMFLSDGKREMQVRRIMEEFMPQAIAAKELRVVDAVEAALADTMDKTMATLKKGWDTVQKVAQQQRAADAQNQQVIADKNNQTTADIVEKQLSNKLDNTILQVLGKQGILTQEAKNKFVNDEADREHERSERMLDMGDQGQAMSSQSGGQNSGQPILQQ